jgi:hypothetical protein
MLSVSSYEEREAKLQVETKIEKYINYHFSNLNQGTMLQYQIKSKIEYEKDIIPVKASELKIQVNQIDGKYPYRVKVMNKETEYDENTGILTIKEIVDHEYTIICYYDTYSEEKPERDLHLEVTGKVELETEDNAILEYQGGIEGTVTENIGRVTSIERETSDIYNGAMKSNQINGTSYTTSYQEIQKVIVSQAKAQEKIEIKEIVPKVNYKSTKIVKQDMIDLLGEKGTLEILDVNGNRITCIDSETEVAEDGTITVCYENEVEAIILLTSEIQNEGILRLGHTKEIKSNMTEDVKMTNQVKGIIGETDSYCEEWEDVISWKEAQTNIEMSVNNTTWTNEHQNEVTFDVILHANTEKDKLLREPTIKIELPSEVEKVILQNSNIFHENGLILQEVSSQINANGRQEIVASLTGKQTEYEKNEIELTTDVKIAATIILKKDISSTLSTVNLQYTNGSEIEGDIEVGSKRLEVQIEDYQEEVNSIIEETKENYQEAKKIPDNKILEGLAVEVAPVKGETNLSDGDIVYEGEYIKYNIKITNNSNQLIENLKIVGNVPEGTVYAELDADYYQYDGKYDYNKDDNIKTKEIEIQSLEVGESITKFYEIQANDLDEEEIEKIMKTDIQVKAGETTVAKFELSNVIKKAKIKVFLSANLYGYRDTWNFHIKVEDNEKKESTKPKKVKVTVKLPKEIEVKHFYDSQNQIEYNEEEIPEDNIFELELETDREYYINGIFNRERLTKIEEISKVELTATASANYEGITYQANENRIIVEYNNIAVSMSSENEGEEVEYGEEINYEIKIDSIGRTNVDEPNFSFIGINIKDLLPEEVKPINVTYDNWEAEKEEIREGEQLSIKYTGNFIKKDFVTEDLYTLTDEQGNRLPEINLDLLIPNGKGITIKVKTIAGFVYEKTKIENSVTVEGGEAGNKTSNIVTHIILPKEYEGSQEPDNPDNPDNPDKPVNPDEPDNPVIPDGKYILEGMAWIDENEDGQRQSTEKVLSGINTMLVDVKNATIVKDTIKTDKNGKYRFTNLSKGNYIILFQYDTNQYHITEYQKAGVATSLNSDAITKEVNLDGERIKVGLIEVADLNNSVSNLDVGFVKNKVCDLKLDKSISKITVTTKNGTKQYTYDNAKLAKVEVKAKEINGAIVTIEYKIVITNEGELATTVGKVLDYLPADLTLAANQKDRWTKDSNGQLSNVSMANKKIQPGKSETLTLIATKKMTENNTGTFVNAAEIGEMSNILDIKDKDSKPANKVKEEDDYSEAELIISVNTGVYVYISIGILMAIIIGILIAYVIKKYGIEKIGKISLMITLFMIFTIGNNMSTYASYYEAYYKVKIVNHDASDEFYDNAECRGNVAGWCANQGWPAHGAGGNCDVKSTDPVGYSANHTNIILSPGTNKYDTSYLLSTEKTSEATVRMEKQNSDIKMKINGDDCFFGPFSMKTTYTEEGYIKNKSTTFEVKDGKGQNITEYTICDENGNHKDIVGTGTFYLKIPKAKCINGISRIRATTHIKYQYTEIKKYAYSLKFAPGGHTGKCQYVTSVSRYYVSENDYKESSERNREHYVEWTGLPGCIEITKVDADQKNQKLPGVKIRLYSEEIGYDKIFTTDENGYLLIENLLSNHIYYLEEIETPHYGYLPEVKEAKKVTAGSAIAICLENTKHTGNVKVIKKDNNNETIKLDGIGFKIKNEEGKYLIAVDHEGKIQKNPEGTIYLSNLQYTSEESEATEFKTDDIAELKIANLLTGKYTLIETSVGEHDDYYETDGDYIIWDTEQGQEKGKEAVIDVTRQKSYDTEIGAENKIIPDGWYEIETALNTNKVLNLNGNQIEIKERNNSIMQQFYMAYVGDGAYTISLKNANKQYPIVVNNENKIVIAEENKDVDQTWLVKMTKDGYFNIISKEAQKGIEVKDNTNVIAESVNNSASQKFKLVELQKDSLDKKANQVTVLNTRKYIKLSGRVWEDIPWMNGKESERNNYLYNTGEQQKDVNDKLLANVTVRLKDKNEQTVEFKDNEGNIRTEIETNAKGEYTLNNILIDKLDEYYIEFTYNGMKYESVPASIEKETVGNKAIEKDNRTKYNNSYATIKEKAALNQEGETTHLLTYNVSSKLSTINYGNNLKYGYEGQAYPINGTFNDFLIQANTRNAYDGYLSKVKTAEEIRESGIEEIENINLGLVEREQPDLSLIKDVESIQVSVNNATHIYKYGDRFNANLYSQYNEDGKSGYDMSPQVRYASKYGSMSYTRALYASDVHYDELESDDKIKDQGLRVKMTYKIGIKSSVSSLNSIVNEIEDYYDTKYFEPGKNLNIGKEIDKDGNIKGEKLEYLSLGTSGNNGYHKIRIKGIDLAIEGDKTEGVIFVQVEVKPDKIIEILEKNYEIENYAEIASYSIKDKDGKTYAGIDKDSQPGNLVIGNQDTYEDDTDKAPGIQLVLQEERKVQGTVFMDKTEGKLMTGEIREGDGIYDKTREVGVDDVTVELRNRRTSQIAQVYNAKTKKWEAATTKTKNGGNYEIGGLLPETKEGYELIYTWGGQTYKKEDGTEELIRVQDYKGTIYNKEQEEKIKNGNNTWYKARDPRYSDAIDDYTTREAIDRQTQMLTNYNKEVIKQYNGSIQLKNNHTETLITQMQSTTPGFIVNLEYNEGISNHRDEYDLDSNGNIKMNGPYIVKKEAYQNLMKNIDFGIVERARQILALTKEVKKVRLILNNGTVLINAEIGADGKIKDQVKYATYIPNSEAAKGQVKMEVDNELLQGARLEVQYGFKVENISELDYLNRDYYTYGNGYGMNNNELVSLNADTVIDYVDNNLAQNTENTGGWIVCPEEDKQKLITEKGLLASELKQTLIETNTVLTTQTLSKPLQPKGTTHQEATLTVYRMLPSIIQDEDSIIGNDAEIIKVIKSGGSTLTTTPGNYVPSQGVKEADEAEAEAVTIVQPTGLTINYIAYTLLSISSLGILVSGIILIKKFVLK